MGIRAFRIEDLAALYAVQLKCPQAAQWREDDYLELSRDANSTVLLAEIEATGFTAVAGYAVFYRTVDEAELRNIAIDPSQRRKGLARALLAAGFRALQDGGVRQLFLEVRSFNQSAISLYTSMEFHPLYTRHDYYHDPIEDALVMARDLAPAPAPPAHSERDPEAGQG
jgi:ribosomal-protein-alanine N-acetyltransferase